MRVMFYLSLQFCSTKMCSEDNSNYLSSEKRKEEKTMWSVECNVMVTDRDSEK